MKNISRKKNLLNSSLIKDSSSGERPSEIKDRFHGSGSDTGLETKKLDAFLHPEVPAKMPEVQSAENRINLCDVKKKNL